MKSNLRKQLDNIADEMMKDLLSMSDEEINQEMMHHGMDPRKEAETVRWLIRDVIKKYKTAPRKIVVKCCGECPNNQMVEPVNKLHEFDERCKLTGETIRNPNVVDSSCALPKNNSSYLKSQLNKEKQ